jgi:hypothetical protein
MKFNLNYSDIKFNLNYRGKQVKLKAKNRNDLIFAVQHHWDMLI